MTMPPRESNPLLGEGNPSERADGGRKGFLPTSLSFGDSSYASVGSGRSEKQEERGGGSGGDDHLRSNLPNIFFKPFFWGFTLALGLTAYFLNRFSATPVPVEQRTGPYQLAECQEGQALLDAYEFIDGPDSLGSAGYNTYTGKKRALKLGLVNVTKEYDRDIVYMSSAPTDEGPRESVRLESFRRYNAGLFLLDLDHMPAGCGQWPAFWLTDAENWPDHGEIDVVEGVNYQSRAKTALHTSDQCSMFAHVDLQTSMTGHWDRATGLPDTFTGQPDLNTSLPADNCYVLTPHQWANQGCVAVADKEDTIGPGLNKARGGVYALEWDPAMGYIRSWVFPKNKGVPENLEDALDTASSKKDRVIPNPNEWGTPYGYFAIGQGSGCSADHFQNMRIVFNLAFCGTVSGNRFFTDCPKQAESFQVEKDPVLSCNAWIQSNPEELAEAYWKVRGVYVYERAWEPVRSKKSKALRNDVVDKDNDSTR
jgi:hypothetical protein